MSAILEPLTTKTKRRQDRYNPLGVRAGPKALRSGKNVRFYSIGGFQVLSAFAAAGAAKTAVTRTFNATVINGTLSVQIARNAAATHSSFINGIEILPTGFDPRTRNISLTLVPGHEWQVKAPIDAKIDFPTGSTQSVWVQPSQVTTLELGKLIAPGPS